MSKAAIYVRVSTGQQAEEGHSLANQKDACAKYAKENRLQVVKTYEDAGVSGTTDDRPAMQRALKETHGFEHLVIYDSTRLGRETNVNQTLRRIFSKASVQIHQVSEGGAFDPNTVSGVFMTAIMDARAKAENIDRSNKSRAGKYAAVRSGNLQIGNSPFGYDLVRQGMNARGKGGKSVLVINEAQAVGVRKVFSLFNKGTSIGEIARRLHKAKIKKPNGNKWTRENVKDILDRETYSRKWTYGKNQTFNYERARKSVSVKVPAIITPAIFHKARIQIRVNSKANSNAVQHDYLLRGRIDCSQCDQVYISRAQRRNGSSKINFYYQHKPDKSHEIRNFRRDDIEKRVKTWIDNALVDPETFVKLLGENEQEDEAMSKATLARLDKAEAKLVEKRANLLELLVERTITNRDWLEKEAEYTAKLALIEAERKQVIDDLQVDPIELAGG